MNIVLTDTGEYKLDILVNVFRIFPLDSSKIRKHSVMWQDTSNEVIPWNILHTVTLLKMKLKNGLNLKQFSPNFKLKFQI